MKAYIRQTIEGHHVPKVTFSWQGGKPTPSGAYLVDTMLANVCKQNVTRFHFEVARLALDLAGGFIATLQANMTLKARMWGIWSGSISQEWRAFPLKKG